MRGEQQFVAISECQPPEQYERTPEPEDLFILDHAQFIFATDYGERLMREILRFLSQP